MDKKYKNPSLAENPHNLEQSFIPAKRGRFGSNPKFDEYEATSVTNKIEAEDSKTKTDFNIVDPEKVSEFLSNHTFLEILLDEAEEAIRGHFRDSPLYLEVITDPDNSDDTQLVLSINPNYTPKVAIKKFDTFNNTWWFNAFNRGQNKLAIMLEYR